MTLAHRLGSILLGAISFVGDEKNLNAAKPPEQCRRENCLAVRTKFSQGIGAPLELYRQPPVASRSFSAKNMFS